MLKRLFADLKLVQERKRFKIYKIPNKSHKQDFLKLEDYKSNPEPVSPAKIPFIFKNPKLGDKKYFWCSCGLSQKQPFCDSSHMHTSFKPLSFIVQQDIREIALCQCKKTSNAPYCDYKACGCLDNREKSS